MPSEQSPTPDARVSAASAAAPRARRARFEPRDTAALIVALVLVGMLLTGLLSPGRGVEPGAAFTAEHVRMLGMVDNSAQRLAHRAGLLLLGALTLAGLMLAGGGAWASPLARLPGKLAAAARPFRLYGGLLVFAAAATVVVLNLQGTSYPTPEGRRARLFYWLVSIILVLCAARGARALKARWFAAAVCAGLAAYALFLAAPGFARAPFLDEALLGSAEWHYSVTLAQGDRLAAGLTLGDEVSLNYGLIPQLALAVFERAAGMLDFGGHIRAVQATQALFLLMAIAAFYLWRPRNPLFVLFAALLTGPWLSTVHPAVYHPNQAGWRSLGLAGGVVLLLLVRRQATGRAALLLGGGAALLLFYNPETGMCLTFGYGLFLVSRLRWSRATAKEIVWLAARALAGAIAVSAAVLILYRLGLGAWPPAGVRPFLGFITRFGQGYGSLPLYPDPLALVMFAHSAYVVALAALRWRRRGLDSGESFRLALAAAILVWFSYYVNRPHPWNLWTYQFLYVFLVADYLDPRRLRGLGSAGLAAFARPAAAALVFVLVPQALSANRAALVMTAEAWRGPSVPASAVSGVLVAAPAADRLLARAEHLARQDDASLLYLTRHSYTTALLTGRFIRLPVQDVFAETITNQDFERVVAEINELSPRSIFFEAPGATAAVAPAVSPAAPPAAVDFYESFYGRLKSRIAAGYELRGRAGGWEVWERRGG